MDDVIEPPTEGMLFDTSVLDSLNKLTAEINEDLLTDGDSDDYGDSYDSADEYTDEDEDPDSGENQLFSMMDDLVSELQMELKQPEELIDDTENIPEIPTIKEQDNIVEDGQHLERESSEIQSPDKKENKDAPVPEPTIIQEIPSVQDYGMDPSAIDRAEKQRRLHLYVKSLIRRVVEMAHTAEGKLDADSLQNSGAKNVGGSNTESQALHGRPRGDSSADRLERLIGALATYNEQPHGEAQPLMKERKGQHNVTVSDSQMKTARATSSYTQRKRREYLLRKLSLQDGAKHNAGEKNAESLYTPDKNSSVSSITAQQQFSRKTPNLRKKKTKQRTNKHKKKRARAVKKNSYSQAGQRNTNFNDNQYDTARQYMDYPHPGEPVSQESLRSLLVSLLALDERLTRANVPTNMQ